MRSRLQRIIPGAAAVAVTLAALGAVWLGPSSEGARGAELLAAERPSLAAPAPKVVKAPAARMRPASCRDCAVQPPAPTGTY